MKRPKEPTSQACQKHFDSGWVRGFYDRLEHSREGAALLGLEAGRGCRCTVHGYLAGLLGALNSGEESTLAA